MPILSFGYGSNMLLRKVQVNVPSAIKLSNAFLPGFRFAFNKKSKDGSGKGNLIETKNPDDKVWGIVIQIADDEKKALDKEEGLGKGYNEKNIIVTPDREQPIEVLAYIADPTHVQDDLWPYDWYRDMVVLGAIENNISQRYISFLKQFPFTIDPDQRRRMEKYSIINRK